MLNAYDCSTILTFKMVKDYENFKKTEFTKKELTDYFKKVTKISEEVGKKNKSNKNKVALEVKKNLEDFCEIDKKVVKFLGREINSETRKKATMYVQGMNLILQGCCNLVYSKELEAQQENANSI